MNGMAPVHTHPASRSAPTPPRPAPASMINEGIFAALISSINPGATSGLVVP